MDCFGTYFTHAQTSDVTRVQSASEWTASVHTLHMPKPSRELEGGLKPSALKGASRMLEGGFKGA